MSVFQYLGAALLSLICFAIVNTNVYAQNKTEAFNQFANSIDFTTRVLDADARDINFDEVTQFLAAHPHWIRVNQLVKKAEESLEYNLGDQVRVCDWFKTHDPVTSTGYRIRGLYCIKQNATFALDGWIFGSFKKGQIDEYLAKNNFSSLQHLQRINQLLITKKTQEVRDMLDLIPQEYKKAVLLTLDLMNDPKMANATRAFGAIEKKYRIPALILYYLRSDSNLNRIKQDWHLLEEAYNSTLSLQNELTQGNLWAASRMKYARKLLLLHQYRDAYKLLLQYGRVSDANVIKLEWLAGWIQLRFLHNPKKALDHFFAANAKCNSASDIAKQTYWIARAFSKLHQSANAARYYEIASRYAHTFYGQIANETLKRKLAINFVSLHGVQRPKKLSYQFLIDLLDWIVAHKRYDLMNYCVMQIINSTTSKQSVSEIDWIQNKTAILYAFSKVVHYLATSDLNRLAEHAAERNILLRLAYPEPYSNLLKYVDVSLAYAVIKNESCFDPAVVGSSGDIGLMQINPKYIGDFAKACKLPVSIQSLYKPEYNIALGTMQLKKLATKYNNYPALIACAYNAGSARTDEWIKVIGDPRKKDLLERVDWFESIVYPATGNYAQKVTAAFNVYSIISRHKTQHKSKRIAKKSK